MPAHISEGILREERRLRPQYLELENRLYNNPRHLRTAETLRRLQDRQISILNNLNRELAAEQPPVDTTVYYAQHILQAGETLRMLAIMYDTTVSEIRRVNPQLPEEPQAGQLINLPIRIPRPPARSLRYVVRPTDTLSRIARKFSTDIDTLVRINNIADPDVIFPGRILIIPI